MKKVAAVCIATILAVVMTVPAFSIAPHVEHRINHLRTARGLSHLRAKPFLEDCARQEARWVANNSLEHVHADLDCYVGTWGEIIGEAPDTQSIVHAWMHSPEHRDIIVSTHYHRFGCAKDEIGNQGVFAYACLFRG